LDIDCNRGSTSGFDSGANTGLAPMITGENSGNVSIDTVVLDLKRMAIRIRSNIIRTIPPGKVGHLGGSSSIADVLAVLYFHWMRGLDPQDPKKRERDRLVFSKGHAVLAQYAALVELGYIDRAELDRVKTLGGVLQGHPDIDRTPGIEAVTGSLGQGLSVSVGMALALRLDGNPARIYCVCGDGELDEGQIWEAMMSAANYRLDNLCMILDMNSVQATGTTQEIFPLGSVSRKFEAFGWNVVEIDGHDILEILHALETANTTVGMPSVIVARTVKGKGFPFAEGQARFHNAALDTDQYALCEAAIAAMWQEIEK
jgi:transketolase